jgi:hypothetical protein
MWVRCLVYVWRLPTCFVPDGSTQTAVAAFKVLPAQKRQPLTGTFQGVEHLGAYKGHGPKHVGAICNPADFSGVVEVPPGVLGPIDGTVLVDLVAPNCEPESWPFGKLVQQKLFHDIAPGIMIRVIS